jgi:hypothetical protein
MGYSKVGIIKSEKNNEQMQVFEKEL